MDQTAKTPVACDLSKDGLFEQAFSNAPIGMALVGLDGRWLKVNRNVSRIVGFDETSLLGKTFQEITFTSDLDTDLDNVRQLLSGFIDSYQMEKRYVHRDGQLVWVRLSVSLVRDAQNEPQFFISQIEDINATKQAEHAMRDAQSKLASQAKALESANTELAQRNEELQRFTRLASHDLREPLRAISGFATLLRKRLDDHLDKEGREFFGFISAGVQRMDEMSRALGELARLDQHPISHEPFPMNRVVEDALQNLDDKVTESGAQITVADLPRVAGSRTLLVQLMQHVLGNAIKYRREQPPQVVIDGVFEEGFFHFRVTDNGIGIPPNEISAVFEPFRGSSGNGCYAGTSVGLTFSKRIVERHGGRIWIESEPGVGTTVHFTVPADPDQEKVLKSLDRRQRQLPRRLADTEQQQVSV